MSELDAFALNIGGASNLVSSDMNKTRVGNDYEEGVTGEYIDSLELNMTDEELLALKVQWETNDKEYTPKVTPRQAKNKLYYSGRQMNSAGAIEKTVSSNLIFEAEETFIPQALSQNPEPVVWSENTEEGKAASNDLKTMLQYHADVLCLRKKLGVMVRHWSIYFVGVLKHGWDEKTSDIKLDIRKPQNFVWCDPNAYIDEYGNYIGTALGERVDVTAGELADMFPKFKNEIMIKANDKAGTKVTYTEWRTDEFCFYSFGDYVLDKHKNEFFNYTTQTIDQSGQEEDTPGMNHFARPKMPYTFLSVFSLQESPHDITNLIEQNIANQDRISERDIQITTNLRTGNNSLILSGISFNEETATQAARAVEDGRPILVPDGQVDSAVKRLPAANLPSAVFTAQENDRVTLRSVFGTQGLSAQKQNEDTTARGMILNQAHDSSRIGGGVGDALEQVADNVFNWWTQLYCVFYDMPHYASIMGSGRAVEYVSIKSSNFDRRFVVSVAPNSMQPKDEITEQNMALDLANKGWLDPINLFKKLNYPDPMETAKQVTIWKMNPQLYFQTYFPEVAPPPIPGAPPGNPPDVGQEGGSPPGTLAQPPADAALSQVPLNTQAMPQ